MVISSYASLINLKLVVSSSKTQYVAVERHFFQSCLQPIISRVRVDEFWYLETYPDVADALQKGLVTSGKDHYVRFGYFENRLPCRIIPDEKWYLNAYPDVREAVKREEFRSAQDHYFAIGHAEGRLPYSDFRLPLE